jgi:hypothetical protein
MLQLEAYEPQKAVIDKTQIPIWLSDPDDSVRMQAIRLFGTDPAAQPKLQDNAFNLEGNVAAAALEAMAKHGTDLDWQAIRQAVEIGTPVRRMTAARLLASRGEQSEAGPIASLRTDPDPDVQRAAAVAIGAIPGDVPAQILTTFFDDTDPYVSSAAIGAASPDNELVARGLLYSAVNDPWDVVRVTALLKLAQSKTERLRKEGWKGMHDDSEWVRSRFIAQAPAEAPEFAEALKTALSDTFPSVRAAAVRRFTSLPLAERPQADWSAIYADYAPEVQDELIQAALAKQIELPAEVVRSYKAGFDKRVAEEAANLP